MKEFSENSASERLSALLGLAAKKNEPIDICPSPEQLSLFIDGQLKKKMRSQMLAHLNQCEPCRSIWLETASYLESKSESKTTSTGQKIIQGIRDFLTPGPLIIGGVTAAILFLVIITGPDINQQIDSGYEIFSNQNNMEAANLANTFIMPWDNATMAFSKPSIQAEKNAFGAGLWQGKNKFISIPKPLPSKLMPTNKKHWQDTNLENQYQFGRFVILLWVVSQLTNDLSDWNKHKKTLFQLHKNLADYANNTELTQSMLVSIEQVTTTIEGFKDKQNITKKKPLQRLLEVIMQKFSPG